MLTFKKNGPGGDFFSTVFRRHDPETKAWGTKPLKQVLRWQRESRKLTLQGAAQFAGIPEKYLRLLEGAGEEPLLAEPLALIPCLQRYAVFLNLNPDLAVAQFIAELEQLVPVGEFGGSAHRTQLLTAKPQPQARAVPWPLLLVLGLGLLAFGSYRVLRGEQRPKEATLASPPPSATVPTLVPGSPPPASSPIPPGSPAAVGQLPPARSPEIVAPQAQPRAAVTPLVQSPAVPSSLPPQTVPGSARYHLRVRATAKTWFHITIDKQPMNRLILRPGQSLEWTAEKGFTLSLGNAGAVKLSLDGYEIPPLAKAGQKALNVRLPSPRRSQEQEVRRAERPRVTKPR
jgi:cytoskeletal protein RodZ